MGHGKEITRWYVSAIILAKEYSILIDNANGITSDSKESNEYREHLDKAIRKAILKGELKAYSGGNGVLLDANIKAYLHGVIYLDQFCEWAQVSLIGCPKEPRKLAAMMEIPLESDVGTVKSEDVKLVAENSKDKTDTLASTLPKPLPRFAAQENAILKKLIEFGREPKKLPKEKNGSRTVKADVRDEMLRLTSVFVSKKTFEAAWERLRATKQIANE